MYSLQFYIGCTHCQYIISKCLGRCSCKRYVFIMNSKQTFTASQALDLILRQDYSSSEASSSESKYDAVLECQSNDLFSSNESEIEFEGSEVTLVPDTPQKQTVLHKNILPKEESHVNENLHIECNLKSCNTILG